MAIKLNVEKAIQAVGVVLRKEGKRASRLRVLKLLYIADRECIKRHGTPLIGSKIVAMKHGPLHSDILDLINGDHIAEPQWSRHFTNVGRDLVLSDEPDVGQLSRPEIDLIVEVVESRLGVSDWDVADETHGFPEWLNNYPKPDENTSRPISLEDLISAVGRDADAASIMQDIDDSDAFNRYFQSLCK